MPSVIQFPEDLLSNPDYAGNYMLFSAKNVSGGVDTRTLKFSDAGGPGALSVALPIPQGLNTAYQNQWDQQGVNAFTSAGASVSGGIMKTIGKVTSNNLLRQVWQQQLGMRLKILEKKLLMNCVEVP